MPGLCHCPSPETQDRYGGRGREIVRTRNRLPDTTRRLVAHVSSGCDNTHMAHSSPSQSLVGVKSLAEDVLAIDSSTERESRCSFRVSLCSCYWLHLCNPPASSSGCWELFLPLHPECTQHYLLEFSTLVLSESWRGGHCFAVVECWGGGGVKPAVSREQEAADSTGFSPHSLWRSTDHLRSKTVYGAHLPCLAFFQALGRQR